MVFMHGFLASLLLASAAQALGSPQLQAHRGASSPSKPVTELEDLANGVKYSNNWAGAVWEEKEGTFTEVAATFTIPTVSGGIHAIASIWVGIDGWTCKNAILQTGVDVSVGPEGQPVASAWYQWYPDDTYYFDNFPVSVGDTIRAAVIAFSATSGVAFIENFSTGSSVYEYLTSNYALCGQNAEWIVEDYSVDNSLVPFGNFGTVTFADAIAFRPIGAPYTPSGATIIDMKQGNTVLTSVSVKGDDVTIKYI